MMSPIRSSSPSVDSALADEVARQPETQLAPLDRVGMRGIEMPIRLLHQGSQLLLPARVSAFVDLRNPEARGIHMSRLYHLCDTHLGEAALDREGIARLLQAMLDSHAGLSERAAVAIRFELPLRRAALLSGLSGWRQYPVALHAHACRDRLRCELHLDLLYSSTCPGSAAMSRQLVRQRFCETFGSGPVEAEAVAHWLESPAGGAATPHAQRSRARIRIALGAGTGAGLPLPALIELLEKALATPVQGAVKRIDEQEFARLNGAHPMYCEDAARRLRTALETLDWIDDYGIEVAHYESLHPHDAVAQVVKGVPGGFAPDDTV